MGDRVENTALKLGSDRQIKVLRENQEAVAYTLQGSDPETQTIIKRMYFNRNDEATVITLAIELSCDRTGISRKRMAFFKALAKELGLHP